MTKSFLEIEHKYVVDEDFDKDSFFKTLQALDPKEFYAVEVTDTYFVSSLLPKNIFRHRYDNLLQQMTVKSFGGSIESRVEINLNLARDEGNQIEAVTEFMKTIGAASSITVHKSVTACVFDDCEVVYYIAHSENKFLRCVEFEAIEQENLPLAIKVLEKYEKLTHFDEKTKSSVSLYEFFVRK